MTLRERASSKDILWSIMVAAVAAVVATVCGKVVRHMLTNHVWVCYSTNISTFDFDFANFSFVVSTCAAAHFLPS